MLVQTFWDGGALPDATLAATGAPYERAPDEWDSLLVCHQRRDPARVLTPCQRTRGDRVKFL